MDGVSLPCTLLTHWERTSLQDVLEHVPCSGVFSGRAMMERARSQRRDAKLGRNFLADVGRGSGEDGEMRVLNG